MQWPFQMLLNPPMLARLNGLLANALLSHPEKAKKLQDNPLHITITDADIAIRLHTTETGIQLSLLQEQDQASLSISGNMLAMLKLMLSTDKLQAISTNSIHVQGDTGTLYSWQSVFSSVHIDWELALAEHLGNIRAAFIAQAIRQLIDQAKRYGKDAPTNLTHSLVTNNMAVSTAEWDSQIYDNQAARFKADALRRRIDKL